MKPVLTADRLRELTHYDPLTGIFTRVKAVGNNKIVPEERAGCVRPSDGYRVMYVDGKLYQEHRLAWLYMWGEWPTFKIDHKNRDKADNVFDNLRDVTAQVNAVNRPQSDYRELPIGVYLANSGRYAARARGEHLGMYETSQRASEAYQAYWTRLSKLK